MNEFTCVIIGAGYAGINAVKAIRKSFPSEMQGNRTLRLVLIDKNPYHLRKVLLFKPAAGQEDITIPLRQLFPEGVEFVQATVTKIESGARRVLCSDSAGNEQVMHYDVIVMAAGSVVRQPEPSQGGIALTGQDAAARIRDTWKSNLRQAVRETNAQERQRCMSIAVAGAGISGIETSAELAVAVRAEAEQLGLDPDAVRIYLLNAHDRLFQDGSAKVGIKLERSLTARGVTTLHGCRALQEAEGCLTLSNGQTLPVGLCVWTLGLMPHPMLRSMGLPLTEEGYVIVDASYRVEGASGVYAIGDCARIVDPLSGLADGKTCKEGNAQAERLGKILLADVEGHTAPTHKRFMDFFCIGLGPDQGIVWIHQWGLDILLTGKLGWKIRKLTWDMASLLR